MSETIKYAADGVREVYSGFWPAVRAMEHGDVVTDWLLNYYGFKPFEIERRRFLDRHHHLINPRVYTPSGRPVWDALPDIVKAMASISVDEQRSLFRQHCKRRVRVPAWRRPNQDLPEWDVILARSLAGYVMRTSHKWSARP